MPWLDMDKVLFVHVPRCGGTSITKHHRVGFKARQGMNLYYKLGIMYYYYRYRLLERANFPVFTWENLFASISITIGIFVYFFVDPIPPFPYVMWALASCTVLTSTFIWTAPVTMRSRPFRRLLMFVQSRLLCGLGSDTRYLVGTNEKAYLFHITAERAIKFNYVTAEQVRRCGFSIVRNPYSRVVSMFEYNRRPCESFAAFVRSFHAEYCRVYEAQGSAECRDIYCHVLPMHAYTHSDHGRGPQLVGCVIKQEHLKRLVASDWAGSRVPDAVRRALTGIPHANRRKRRVAWQRYYTQETMDLVLDMYRRDFELFGYALEVPGRPDLVVKAAALQQQQQRTGGEASSSSPSQDLKRRQRYAKLSAQEASASAGTDVEAGVVRTTSGSSDELAPMELRKTSFEVEAEAGAEATQEGKELPRAGQETEESSEEMALRREASEFVMTST